jgi:hypothetical protein
MANRGQPLTTPNPNSIIAHSSTSFAIIPRIRLPAKGNLNGRRSRLIMGDRFSFFIYKFSDVFENRWKA